MARERTGTFDQSLKETFQAIRGTGTRKGVPVGTQGSGRKALPASGTASPRWRQALLGWSHLMEGKATRVGCTSTGSDEKVSP